MKWLPTICALLLCGSAVPIIMLGCVIRIGPGGDGEETIDNSGGSAGSTAQGGDPTQGGAGSAEWVPEEQEAIAVIESSDQNLATRSAFAGEYTSSALAALIEANVPDPAAIDTTALAALVDQYAPEIWQEANAWAEALDASIIQAATITPKPECQEAYGRSCSYSWGCLFDNIGWSTCILTGCGKGACPSCPSLFDIDALIVQKWCSYTCVSTKDQSIVGIAIHLKLALNGSIEKCFLFDSPVK